MDPEQTAEFHAHLDDENLTGPYPEPPPPLGPGELRTLLRECVNVVEPGDILIIRMPPGTRADSLRDLHDLVDVWLTHNSNGVRALLVPAEEIKVLHPAPPMVTFGDPPGEIDEAEVKAARDRLDQIRKDLLQ